MTFQELIYTAVTNAMRGMKPNIQASSNAEFIAQTLFDEVSQSVCEEAAANEYKRSLLRRTKTITLAVGQLPTASLTTPGKDTASSYLALNSWISSCVVV